MKFSRLIAWLPLGFTIMVLCGVVYGTVQQVYRQDANDPQIQMAEDLAAKIAAGVEPRSVVPTEKVDIATSLAPIVMVFDRGKNVLASSAVMHGAAVKPPNGALGQAQEFGTNQVTWQPAPNVRQALVIVANTKDSREDIVAVGRSLREVENRVARLSIMVMFGWLVAMVGSLGLWMVTGRGAAV